MNRRATRIWIWLAMIAAGGTMFQFTTNTGAYSGGCGEFYANGIVGSVDFCYLFDCENGFFGGAIDPCDPNNPSLVDCPGYIPPTDGDDTTNGTDTGDTDTTDTTDGLFGFGF